jgi:Helicase HerA, central domain/Type IV secretory system Conjugative DNA transfer
MLFDVRKSVPSVTLGHWGKWPLRFPFTLDTKKLKTHKHVMGITGQGKSKLLAHMTASLILQGVGCCLIDPHSDLARDVLTLLYDNKYFDRPGAFDTFLYVDFNRSDRFIPFNVLKQPYPMHEVARNLVEVCTRAWSALADGAAPLFENIMLASVPVLVENDLPLTALDELLSNKSYRDRLLTKCSDPKIIAFFQEQFDQWGRDQPVMIGSALRRAFLLSYTPALRYTLGQKENKLNFRELMDSNTSIIVNLGGLDEQTQRILGCLITVGFEVAALSRADMPEHKRTLYNLIMDEFSMFSAQSEEALARVLSLARKYNLYLTLAHQTWSQLSERLQGALQNSTPIYFRLGYDDAVWAAPRLGRSNPYHKKHEVRALKEKDLTIEHHPLYFQMQEEYEEWTRRIEGLWPQQAYVKYNRNVPKFLRWFIRNTRTVKIHTIHVPPPKADSQEIEKIKEYYAQTLMKPMDSKEETMPQVINTSSPAPKRQRRLQEG